MITADPDSHGMLAPLFREGRAVQKHELESLISFPPTFGNDRRLSETLGHLALSRALVNGAMSVDFYHHHYQYDRASMTRWALRKNYLENREIYELAFVAGFKAVERFLDTSFLKAEAIAPQLLKLGRADITPQTTYSRYFERFSGGIASQDNYKSVICRFLKIRNAVAAHANQTPPSHLLASQDTVLELQLFVKEMCVKSCSASSHSNSLPSRALNDHLVHVAVPDRRRRRGASARSSAVASAPVDDL